MDNERNRGKDCRIAASGQIMGTVLIVQKCDGVIKIFKDCLDKIWKNPSMITQL